MLKNMLLINSIHLIAYIFYIEWINEAFENYKFISDKDCHYLYTNQLSPVSYTHLDVYKRQLLYGKRELYRDIH